MSPALVAERGIRRHCQYSNSHMPGHLNVVPLPVTRGPATPLGLRPIGTLRPLEQVLAVLIDAGCPQVTALIPVPPLCQRSR